MKHLRFITLALMLAAAFGAQSLVGRSEQPPAAAPARTGRRPVRRAAFPVDRPGVDVGPHRRPRRLRSEPGDLLRRHRARRRLEDDQQRRDVRGAVPGPGADVDRRRHRLAEQSGPRLGRHRRVEQPPEHVVGRRRLQVDRRRQDLHEHGAPQTSRTSTASSSIRATTTSCSSRRPAALWGPGGERGVYKTTDGGKTWKQVLKVDDDTGANDLVMAATEQPDPVRVDVSAAPHAVLHERRRPGQRHLEVDRRRRDLDAARRAALPDGPLGRIALDVYRRSAEHSLRADRRARRRGRRRGGGGAAPAAAAEARSGGRRRRPAATSATRRERPRRPASIDPTMAARRGAR